MEDIDLISKINPIHKFRDPIYGYIWLTDNEKNIIDQPIFQRLRRIHQLALTKYVYPTAEHSRFTHSLGVLQSATNIFLDLYKINKKTIYEIFGNADIIKTFKILRYVALLHDIGHLPFSHATEKAFLGEGVGHEDIGKYIISENRLIKETLEQDCERIQDILPLLKGSPKSEYYYIKRFISGEFDADRADYLLRDSHICGVKYGLYDYLRYVGSFYLYKYDNDNYEFGISSKNIHAIESFILARHYYNIQIPYHRTRVGYDIALEQFIKQNVSRFSDISGITVCDNKSEIDFEKFIYFDDYSIFEEIKKSHRENNLFGKILMRNDRLHPVFDREVSDINKKEIGSLYSNYIDQLRNSQFVENEDFFKYEKKLDIHKIPGFPDEKENGSSDKNYIVIDNGNNIGNLLDYSPIFRNLANTTIYLYRVYIISDKLEKAKKILYDLINPKNKFIK
ncbi:MAG: HD domain-containing protein [Deltaproteobacteria bacterium]|jgi:HD superfamily phosphohydrolase|nr:HD domain-containing protein [Deltaproteobacteria bacterium]MCL5880521.1 HD domain-containing protein [Deltaproteobacteria bacterium]